MKAFIDASPVCGRVNVPASKSYTIRSVIAAALAEGKSIISNPLNAGDTHAVIEVIRGLGAGAEFADGRLIIMGGSLQASRNELHCGESAATLRFMAAVCATLPGTSTLTFEPGLARRPMKPLLDILEKLGAETEATQHALVIRGTRLEGGLIEINHDESSQFISALMLIGPLTGQGITLQLASLPRSLPYIKMTQHIMKIFGVQASSDFDCTRFSISPQKYQSSNITVEGDWSSASYLVSSGALHGEVNVVGLDPLSLQADKVIISILQKMGAFIQVDKDSVTTRSSRLYGVEYDMSNCIDLLPTAAVLASMAEGDSRFTGIARARLKESNRVRSLTDGFRLMGICTREQEDVLEVTGGVTRHACIDAGNDHRIAMAFAMAGLKNGGIVIDGAECVSKTYPDYWHTLQNLGGKVRLHNE